MNYNTIDLEIDGALALITISRPKALNALNQEAFIELRHCLGEIRENKEIGVVIITGSGDKAFVAGADISHFEKLDSIEAARFAALAHSVMDAIEALPQPVIAAVNGYALGGGCELALACDIRVAAENAKFGQPEINLGIIPCFGGTQRLPRIVGKGVACALLYTGEMIDAGEAHRIGLVNRVVAADELLAECRELALKIAAKSPVALRICKETVTNGLQMDLNRANQYEICQLGLCFASEDQKEGMKAFLEKRPADFKGK